MIIQGKFKLVCISHSDYRRQSYCHFFCKFGQISEGIFHFTQSSNKFSYHINNSNLANSNFAYMRLYQNSFWDLATFKCPTFNSNPKYFWFSKFYYNCWWIFRRCFLIQSEAAILRINFPDLQLIEFLFDDKKLISIFRYCKMPWPHSFDFRCQFLEKSI